MTVYETPIFPFLWEIILAQLYQLWTGSYSKYEIARILASEFKNKCKNPYEQQLSDYMKLFENVEAYSKENVEMNNSDYLNYLLGEHLRKTVFAQQYACVHC